MTRDRKQSLRQAVHDNQAKAHVSPDEVQKIVDEAVREVPAERHANLVPSDNACE
jgi:hypothetical protein